MSWIGSDDVSMTSSERPHGRMTSCPPMFQATSDNCNSVTSQRHACNVPATNSFQGLLELRKEKSRDAARWRRGKENAEFYELARLLPLPSAITGQLDKASVVRLTVSYLKLKQLCGEPPHQNECKLQGHGQCHDLSHWSHAAKMAAPNDEENIPPQQHMKRTSARLVDDVFEKNHGTHLLQSLDGFVFVLSTAGRILYISETVSIYLGLSQVEMTGSNVFDYIYRHDQQELADKLHLTPPSTTPSASAGYRSSLSPSSDTGESTDSVKEPSSTDHANVSPSQVVLLLNNNALISVREFGVRPSSADDVSCRQVECSLCVRMKSTLTKRGVHLKSAGYRVVQLVARSKSSVVAGASSTSGLSVTAVALPLPTLTEFLLDTASFVVRLLPNFTVIHTESRISELTSMSPEDLVRRNLYDFCHVIDLETLRHAHFDVLNKGQSLSDYWRMMNKHGGFVWVQMRATLTNNTKNSEDQHIVAIIYVLSGPECVDQVMTVDQMMSTDGVIRQAVAAGPTAMSSTFDSSASRPHCGPLTPDNDKISFTQPTSTAQRRQPMVSHLNDHRQWSQLHHQEDRFHLTPSCVAQEKDRNRRQLYDYHLLDGRTEKTAADGNNANGITSLQPINRQSSNRFVSPMAGVATYLAAANLPSTFPSASSSFSVLDLERAMNRHLPPPSSHSDTSIGDIAPVVGGNAARPDHHHPHLHHYQQPTVWSVCWMTGASLPPPPGHVTANPESRGLSSASSSSSSTQLLPASSLLRSLHDAAVSRYRRDTVIRSTGAAYHLPPTMRQQQQLLHDKGRIRQRSLVAADDDGCTADFGTPHGGVSELLLTADDSASKTDEARDCGMEMELSAVDGAFQTVAGSAICGDYRPEVRDMHSTGRGDDDDDPAAYAIEEEDVDTMWLHLAAAVVPYHMTSNWNDVIAK